MLRWLFALAVVFTPSFCFANDVSNVQLEQLKSLRHSYEIVDESKRFGQKSKTVGSLQTKTALLKVAQDILKQDEPISYEQLVKLTTKPKTAWDSASGFVTFTNIVLVTAAMILVVALGWLTKIYLLGLFNTIPPVVKEFLIYLACALAIAAGKYVPPEFQLMLVLPGCLGLIGALYYTSFSRALKVKRGIYEWILTLAWAAVAVVYGSEAIGFMSCFALLSALGFTSGMFPGTIFVGFDSKDLIPRTTLAAFVMLSVYVAMEIFDPNNLLSPDYQYFSAGFGFLGSFVYFLGVLVLSWKGYHSDYMWRNVKRDKLLGYIGCNVLAVVSGIVAIYLGSVFDLGLVLGVCGTFFYIYILEKYYEIPWKGTGWAWSALGLAAILYGFVVFAKLRPELFIFM